MKTDINLKRILGIINAPSNKRYKNFINTVVDREYVWLLDGGEGYCTYDIDNEINIIVYPEKAIADYFSNGATPVMMEIHDFCRECENLIKEKNIGFAVCPNEVDAIKVSPQVLYEDLLAALEEVENFMEI